MKRLIFRCLRTIAAPLLRTPLARSALVARVYKWLFKRLNPQDLVLIECQGSKMYINPQDEGTGMYLMTTGVFEPGETELVKGLLKPGMVVADIGANIGYFSLIASRCVGESGRVYSFEPHPGNFELINKSVAANGYTNVTPMNKAVSEKSGTMRFFIDTSNSANGSFGEGNVPGEKPGIDVETVTLDEFFASAERRRPDFIKMDAQGAEGLILAGGDTVLSEAPLQILLEFWPFGLQNCGTDPANFLERLRNMGFRCTVIDDDGSRRVAGETSSLIDGCVSRAQGTGFVNLLFEK